MRSILFLILMPSLMMGCPKDEPPPPKPPVLNDVQVECGDAEGEDYPLVNKVTVNVSDEDRDLIIDSLTASVNGLVIELEDGASIDDVFEWTPPGSWDPKMTCRGDFRVRVEIADATGLTINETRVVTK